MHLLNSQHVRQPISARRVFLPLDVYFPICSQRHLCHDLAPSSSQIWLETFQHHSKIRWPVLCANMW